MATLKVPTQTPSAAEDAEQLHKAFQGLLFFFSFIFCVGFDVTLG